MKEPSEKELVVFPLSQKEWQEVYRLANEQTVCGLVFQGVCLLPDDFVPPLDLLQLWVAHVDSIERMGKKMNNAVEKLLLFFQKKGLNAILLKGQGIARLYEHPLQRSCGDIDLYFNEKKSFINAINEVRKAGYNPRKMSDGAYIFFWKDIDVEVHPKLMNIYNPLNQKRVYKLIEKEGFDDHSPTPLLNLILLNTHILKHLMGHGIGLRQLADMARALYTYKGKYSEDEYRNICMVWGIGTWSSELNGILTKYLGLPTNYLPASFTSEKFGEEIMQKVLLGGNFGKYGKTRGMQYDSAFVRKWHTALCLIRTQRLYLKLAPREAFFMLLDYIRGQLLLLRNTF